MATALQSVQGISGLDWRTKEGVHLFGIRHLSPAGAWHIRRFLERIKPEIVLIETPSDTETLINDLTKTNVKPPVALLCYTVDIPVHSIVYPLAKYSPEYQALMWAKKNKKASRFIDLPSNIKAPLYRLEEEIRIKTHQEQMIAEAEPEKEFPEALRNRIDYYRYQNELYEKTAILGGEESYDAYWERSFEHNLETDVYLKTVTLHSAEMRSLAEGWEKEADPLSTSINALRESYMKKRILEAIAEGYTPEKIVVIVGAYHVAGLLQNDPMDDKEFANLPKTETRMTLMPYSYYRLSSFSGYGAGNYAPYYFEMMYEAMEANKLDSLPSQYISKLSREYRKKQGYSSTAQAIEAVRLAHSLQYIHNGTLPTLKDLHDSAVSAMAGGNLQSIAETFALLDIGTKIGSLPDGVSQTPIQDDFNRQLKELKLEKYKTNVSQDLVLDLREDRKVKSEKLAFIDLERSIFLNRLNLLGIDFADRRGRSRDDATWKEVWILCWKPETEIKLVESVIFGDTIKAAASYVIKDKLEKAENVLEVAKLIIHITECHLKDSILDALKNLQALSSITESFTDSALSAREMSFLIQYGSIRRFDTSVAIPILQQLFLKAVLLLYGASACNDDSAKEISECMKVLHQISQEHDEVINDAFWLAKLKILAKADDRNPMLSGFALSILMERGEVSEEDLAVEVSRHLSTGNTPEAGASWFEGLCMRNRQLLLSRIMLWTSLDAYLQELDDEDFKRTLVCLRRAFSVFEPREKSGICEILAELWGVDAGNVAEVLQDALSETEKEKLNEALDDLKDFDIDI